MSIDPYQDYLDRSSTRLGALRKIAKTRQAKYGKKGAWTKARQNEANALKGRLARDSNPLLNRPRSELNMIAQGNVNRSFAPLDAQFTQRETQARALADKRQIDEKAFATWYQGQIAQSRASTLQADGAMQSAGTAINQAASGGAAAGNPAAVGAAVAAQPGAVTSAPEATAGSAAQHVATTNAASSSLAALGATRTQQGTDQLNKTYAYLDAIGQANSTAAYSRVGQDLSKTLDAIASDRTSASIDRADKLSSEFARLLDQEVTKAGNNRDYQLASSQLGAKIQNDQANAANDAGKLKLAGLTQAQNAKVAKLKLNLENRKLTEAQRHNSQTELASLIGADAAKKNADTARAKFLANPTGSKGGGKAKDPTNNRGGRQDWGSITQRLDTMRNSSKDINTILKGWSNKKNKNYAGPETRNALRTMYAGGKLSKSQKSALKSVGIHVPSGY